MLFDLDKGLYLEDKNVLIPWNSSYTDIAQIENTEVTLWNGPYAEVSWPNSLFWNGLCFNVQTVFTLDSKRLPVSRIQNFRFFMTDSYDPRLHALDTKEKLIQRFGKENKDESNDIEYKWIWKLQSFEIILGVEERYSTVFHFHLQNIA